MADWGEEDLRGAADLGANVSHNHILTVKAECPAPRGEAMESKRWSKERPLLALCPSLLFTV